MNPMAERAVAWIFVLLVCSLFALMIWKPDIFTLSLRFVLRYYLELILPLFMHGYGLWVAYSRCSNPRGHFAFVVFCCTSAISFALLAITFTYHLFWGVTVIPPFLYIIVSDLLSGNSRLLAKNTD